LLLLHRAARRLIALVLKADPGRLSAERKEWLEQLRAASVEVHLWRPADWDRIQRTLTLESEAV
jgi:hypothetical protein